MEYNRSTEEFKLGAPALTACLCRSVMNFSDGHCAIRVNVCMALLRSGLLPHILQSHQTGDLSLGKR